MPNNLPKKEISRELETKSLAYFGEYLFSLELWDSFNYYVQKSLVDFLAWYSNEKGLKIEKIEDEIKNITRVILKLENYTWEEIEAKIVEIESKLLWDFQFTTITQKLNFWFPENTNLPIWVEEAKDGEERYFRQEYQKLLSEIYSLEYQKQDLENLLKTIDTEDENISQLKVK